MRTSWVSYTSLFANVPRCQSKWPTRWRSKGPTIKLCPQSSNEIALTFGTATSSLAFGSMDQILLTWAIFGIKAAVVSRSEIRGWVSLDGKWLLYHPIHYWRPREYCSSILRAIYADPPRPIIQLDFSQFAPRLLWPPVACNKARKNPDLVEFAIGWLECLRPIRNFI